MKTNYFAGLKRSVATHVTPPPNRQVTQPESSSIVAGDDLGEVLPLSPLLPKEMSTIQTVDDRKALGTESTSLDDWLHQIRQSTSADEVFGILNKFRPLSWTDEQRSKMSRCYIPILERWYDANPDGWLVDGRPANPFERIQLEKYLRGWYKRTSLVP